MHHSRTQSFLIILFLLFAGGISAQDIAYRGSVSLIGLGSSEDALPFWMHRNTNAAIGMNSNFTGLAEAHLVFPIGENAAITGGFAAMYRDNVPDDFQRRDLYVGFQNNWLKATLGSQAPSITAMGLSTTNKNFLMSGNARPLPGLLLEANNPVRITKHLGLDWGIGHFLMNDDRFVDDVMVHYKRLALIITFNEDAKLTGQIQHYAQWGGNSPVFGQLPDDLGAFFDVFFASKSKEINVDGEIENAVGNHLGSFLLDYEVNTKAGRFNVYHDHPFEDGSGTRFANFPDGLWGAFYKPRNQRIIRGILYEYTHTNDQSSNNLPDNYFRNNVYRSGWVYEGNVIGTPLILIDPSVEINDMNTLIVSNRVQAHHLGVTGRYRQLVWIVRTTIAKHSGTFNSPLPETLNSWYNQLALFYTTASFGTFSATGGLDSSNLSDTVIGGALGYIYRF